MLQIYTLHDLETKTHGKPMFYSNDEQAKQQILKFFTLANPELELKPKNFEVHYHGTFNELTGELIALPLAKIIINCKEIIQQKEDQTLDSIRTFELEIHDLQKEITILKTEKNLLVNNQLEKEQSK